MSSSESTQRGYIHGYSKEEQDRLYHQARFLENNIFREVRFDEDACVLEVGCGVGAQTEILLRRFPTITVDGVDASPEQLKRAKERLAEAIQAKRVTFHQADAQKLPFPDNSFDGAFICWFLEHVEDPVAVLKEVNRALKPGGRIFCNEVLNASFYVHPYSPATLKYWFEMNDRQWTLKGDPFVGAKLANLLMSSDYRDIQTRFMTEHYDNRTPKQRAEFIEYWTNLLLSSAPELMSSGRVDQQTVDAMAKELDALKRKEDSVIFIGYMQATAVAL